MNTSRSLYLLRHAKSDWNAEYGSDHERPLNKRGRKAASTIGTFLSRLDQIPDKIISSTAVRARTTVEVAADTGGWGRDIDVEESLYEASADRAIETVQSVDDRFHSVMLVGHQPTWSELVLRLVGGARLRFPTAGLARIDFEPSSWKDVGPGTGTLVWFVIPKLLQRFALSAREAG